MSYIEGPLTIEDKSDKTSEKDTEDNKVKSRKAASKLISKEITTVASKDKPADQAKNSKSNWLKSNGSNEILLDSKDKLKDNDPVSQLEAPDEQLSLEERAVIISTLHGRADQELAELYVDDPQELDVRQAIDDLYNLVADDGIEPLQAEAIVLAKHGINVEQNNIKPLEAIDERLADDLAPSSLEAEISIDHQADVSDNTAESEVDHGGSSDIPPELPPTDRDFHDNSDPTPPQRRSLFADANYNNIQTSSTAIVPESNATREYYEDNSNVIAGLIIGYLIGRRRGRKKTEKRLIPIQKKLEKQVGQLEQNLLASEYRVKQLVTKSNKDSKTRFYKEQHQIFNKDNLKSAAALPTSIRLEEIRPLQRVKAPEARLLHAAKPAPERIGRLLVETEIHTKARVEQHKPETRPKEVIKTEFKSIGLKQVETMNRVDLLKISQKMFVEGTSLRQIYETHLVGEKGLRRLVTEYLKGGDVQKVLRKEIVEREIDFERDPIMRDLASTSSADSRSSSAVLQQMINQAEGTVTASSEEAAFYKAKADYEVDQRVNDRKRRKKADVGIISLIVILSAVVSLLLVNHR
jgi:hypothetical protein